MERAQIVLLHQPRDSVFAACLSRFTQIEEGARGAANPVARGERRADQPQQARLF